MIEQRLANLRASLAAAGVDALVVSQAQNIRYMSGFTSGDGMLVISQDHAQVVTDFRYFEQVGQQAPQYELAKIERSPVKALAQVISALGLKKVAFESQEVSVQTFAQWQEAMPEVDWAPTTDLVESLRVIKDAVEVAKIEQAVRIADEAMQQLMADIQPGMTEREVAWNLEVHMRTHGAEGLSFTTIVASGPNGSLPHAVTSERVIKDGDSVVIDMGCVYQGYCSDMTRSFCVGAGNARYEQVWQTVLQAQLLVEQALKPGMTGVEADGIARKMIYDAGYEGKFGHGLGHGVGLAIHEGPRASYTSTDTLQEGMIVTVEPGIYIPDWGGVRTEDMVVMTKNGCRVLTQTPKPMVVAN